MIDLDKYYPRTTSDVRLWFSVWKFNKNMIINSFVYWMVNMTSSILVFVCFELLTFADGQLGKSNGLDTELMQKTETAIPSKYQSCYLFLFVDKLFL